MMTFIMFLAGMGLIAAIARYNESDKLFWKLSTAFVGSIIAASVAVHVLNDNKEQDTANVISESPTQVSSSLPCSSFYTVTGMPIIDTRREKSPKPVSKDTLIKNNDTILSKVSVSTRGQPYQTCMYYDDS